MSNHFEERDPFEERLRSLRPKPVSGRLQAELSVAVSKKAGRRVISLPRRIWVALAWAAGLIVLLGGIGFGMLGGRTGSRGAAVVKAGSSPSEVKETTDWVLGCRQVAIWHSPDGVPYRVMQWLSVRQTTVKDPVSGKDITQAEPKQRVVLLAMEST